MYEPRRQGGFPLKRAFLVCLNKYYQLLRVYKNDTIPELPTMPPRPPPPHLECQVLRVPQPCVHLTLVRSVFCRE